MSFFNWEHIIEFESPYDVEQTREILQSVMKGSSSSRRKILRGKRKEDKLYFECLVTGELRYGKIMQYFSEEEDRYLIQCSFKDSENGCTIKLRLYDPIVSKLIRLVVFTGFFAGFIIILSEHILVYPWVIYVFSLSIVLGMIKICKNAVLKNYRVEAKFVRDVLLKLLEFPDEDPVEAIKMY